MGLALTLAGFSLAPESHAADWNVTNHVSVSARIGFNLSASFKGMGGAAGGASSRPTPDGSPYNYDDGYVLTDISGNAGGLTWNWGYDDSASQVSGNSILLHRTSSTSGSTEGDMDGSDPFLGGEISFISQFGARESFRYGFEAAVNFMPFDFDGRSVAQAMSSVTTDAYPFAPGTTPPTATTGAPYQVAGEGSDLTI